MAKYTVNHTYRSRRDGVDFGPYEPGAVVELDPADAEWVNRDSPGCLTAGATVEIKVEPDAEIVGALNRMHKGGRKRAGG